MRYILSVEQKIYFKQQGFVEFEELFLRDEVVGKDPKKLAAHPTLLHLASELFQHKALRFGGSRIIELPHDAPASYTIQDVSCIQGIVGGVLIGLEGSSFKTAGELDALPFPQREGSAIFFSPKTVWDKELLKLRARQKFLLLAYAEPTARFVFNDKDPAMKEVRALGYAYGDRVQEVHFPSYFAR